MKFWTKYKISAALDSDAPLPESLRQRATADPELRRFVNQNEILSRRRAAPAPDAALHDSIMRAVRGAARRRLAQDGPAWSWLPPALAFASLAGMVIWLAAERPAAPGPSALETPSAVLDLGEALPAAPAAAMAPLSNEWARVNHDVQGATQILLASFP